MVAYVEHSDGFRGHMQAFSLGLVHKHIQEGIAMLVCYR